MTLITVVFNFSGPFLPSWIRIQSGFRIRIRIHNTAILSSFDAVAANEAVLNKGNRIVPTLVEKHTKRMTYVRTINDLYDVTACLEQVRDLVPVDGGPPALHQSLGAGLRSQHSCPAGCGQVLLGSGGKERYKYRFSVIFKYEKFS